MTAEFPSYIRTLAEDMRAAVERYEATAKARCIEECPCPLSEALRSAKAFVGAVGLYDAGKLVPGGLPIPSEPIRCFVCGSDEPMNEHRCKPQPECTGFAATWCPVHGECRCPKLHDGSRDEAETDGCPLHADDSAHGAPDDAGLRR